jgi:hypothetical protein
MSRIARGDIRGQLGRRECEVLLDEQEQDLQHYCEDNMEDVEHKAWLEGHAEAMRDCNAAHAKAAEDAARRAAHGMSGARRRRRRR